MYLLSILYIALAFGLISCSSGHQQEASIEDKHHRRTEAPSEDNRTVEAAKLFDPFDLELGDFSDVFTNIDTLPFSINSRKIEDLHKDQAPLSRQQIRILSQHLTDNFYTFQVQWDLKKAIEQDSLIAINQYQNYLDNLDIGMVKSSECYPHCAIKLSDSSHLLIWYINWESYEACPYGYGTHYMATMIKNREVISSAQIAENSGGGDPPASVETFVNCLINKTGDIQLDYYSVSMEDEADSTITERTYRGNLRESIQYKIVKSNHPNEIE